MNSLADESTRPESRLQRYASDHFLQVNALLVVILYLLGAFGLVGMDSALGRAAHTVHELGSVMWWGILIAIFVIGILDKLPQELIIAMLGQPGTRNGIYRAAVAGVLLDLCSHGILMVGAKLYERGASAGQLMAFLIASPWNSISLTFILFALIGVGWTLAFIGLSLVIAILSGLIFDYLVARNTLPANAASIDLPENYPIMAEAKQALQSINWRPAGILDFCIDGLRGARIVLRWLLFGLVVAAAVRAFVSAEDFALWFGPTLLGLGATLLATSIFEVCSEGSVPIAAELMNGAKAPGNSFTFLLAGVATDYTEVMIVKETTASWKIALFIPLITVPQVVLIGAALNAFWGG